MVQWVLTKCCEGIRKGTLKYCMSMKFTVDWDNFKTYNNSYKFKNIRYAWSQWAYHKTVCSVARACSFACDFLQNNKDKTIKISWICFGMYQDAKFQRVSKIIELPHDGILQCSYLDMLYRRLHKHVGQRLSDIHTHYFFLLILILLSHLSLFLCATLAAYH